MNKLIKPTIAILKITTLILTMAFVIAYPWKWHPVISVITALVFAVQIYKESIRIKRQMKKMIIEAIKS